MTFNLVHLGHGETAVLESPDFIDPTITVPKAPQRPNKTRRVLSEMRVALRALYAPDGSVRPSYRKTALLDARLDQCRYIPPEETSLCCGKKVTNPGSSWCEVHHAIVFSRRQSACAQTVDYGHKSQMFSKT